MAKAQQMTNQEPNQRELTPRQKKFAEAFVQFGGNGCQAARAAGYSSATSGSMGSYNIRQPHVRAYVNKLIAERIGPARDALMALFNNPASRS